MKGKPSFEVGDEITLMVRIAAVIEYDGSEPEYRFDHVGPGDGIMAESAIKARIRSIKPRTKDSYRFAPGTLVQSVLSGDVGQIVGYDTVGWQVDFCGYTSYNHASADLVEVKR